MIVARLLKIRVRAALCGAYWHFLCPCREIVFEVSILNAVRLNRVIRRSDKLLGSLGLLMMPLDTPALCPMT